MKGPNSNVNSNADLPKTLPDFQLDVLIAARLLQKNEVDRKLQGLCRYVNSWRRKLILNETFDPPHDMPEREWRELLAPALIHNNKEAVEAIGLIWSNGTSEKDPLIQNLWQYMALYGRWDLMTPALTALHDVARQTWVQRGHETKAHKEFGPAVEDTSTQRSMDLEIEEWNKIGQSLVKLSGPGNGPEEQASLQKMIVDVLATIPDTRAWAAPIFYTHLNSSRENSTDWVLSLRPILQLFNEGEAGFILRKLADISAEFGYENQHDIQQVAELVVAYNPDISLMNWITDGFGLRMNNTSFDDVGYSICRRRLMGGEKHLATLYAKDSPYNIQVLAESYENLFRWIGRDKMKGVSPEVIESLSSLLKQDEVSKLALPVLRSVLDYSVLSGQNNNHGQNSDTGNKVFTTKPRSRRI